ncbi:MAG TPA: PIN domain-containing protein [Candidatus Dormibacteraeota bacterium]|nr:PIN domain-containing protein [Candidatus Dormibacteraeota bacterium]
MTFFVDTSALYALMDADDPNHAAAWAFWRGAADAARSPVTHNYVVLESCALVHRRLGIQALQDLVDVLLLPVTTVFVDEELHRAALLGVLNARLREVSLVDTVSFEVMRRLGIGTAFAFDSHFGRYGFTTLPSE